ncbi:hypothetical protein RB213_002239 [Colletotrichum asianum]
MAWKTVRSSPTSATLHSSRPSAPRSSAVYEETLPRHILSSHLHAETAVRATTHPVEMRLTGPPPNRREHTARILPKAEGPGVRGGFYHQHPSHARPPSHFGTSARHDGFFLIQFRRISI